METTIMNWEGGDDALQRAALPEVLLSGDIALVFGVSESTARRWCREGALPAIRMNRRWIVLRDDLLRALAVGARDRPPPPTADRWGSSCSLCGARLSGMAAGVTQAGELTCERCALRLDDLRGPGGGE